MNTVKRALALLLTIAMVFSLSINVFAATTSTLEFVPSTLSPAVGEKFTVAGNITVNTGFTALDIHLTYDEENVEFLGFVSDYDADAEENILRSDFTAGFMVAFNDEDAKISIARTSGNDTSKTGTLFTAMFRALKEGDANISYDKENFSMTSVEGDGVVDVSMNTTQLEKMEVLPAPLPMYTVTLPVSSTYTVETESATALVQGSSFSFEVVLKAGYVAGENFAVKANKVALTADDNGIYTIANIQENQEITVEGVEALIAETGYTASLTPDSQNKAENETAEVKIKLESMDFSSFNALYAELEYDPAYLQLTSDEISGYTLNDNNGKITIAGYGEDKNLGEVITLNFKVLARPENGTMISLVKANADISANAQAQNAPETAYGPQTAVITVNKFTVEYPESDFTGEKYIVPGSDYSFRAIDPNFKYTFNALVNGIKVNVIDNGDGTYTVKGVNGNLVIKIATKTPKTYNVTVIGTEAGRVTFDPTATYMTDYSFTVANAEGYNTVMEITIAGEKYSAYAVSVGENSMTYTIAGKDIIGDINISANKQEAEYSVIFAGSGAGDASPVTTELKLGADYIFAVAKEAGYLYDITATMGDNAVNVMDNGDGTYTISAVSGDLIITINKNAIAETTVAVHTFVQMDNKNVNLVLAQNETLTSGALSYDGAVMFWSEQYNAFAYLVISDAVLTEEEAAAKVSVVTAAEATAINNDGDVNGTSVIDVNDAQLVYDIYNAKYSDFDTVSMYKFLCADMNGDYNISVLDAAAIVNNIINHN